MQGRKLINDALKLFGRQQLLPFSLGSAPTRRAYFAALRLSGPNGRCEEIRQPLRHDELPHVVTQCSRCIGVDLAFVQHVDRHSSNAIENASDAITCVVVIGVIAINTTAIPIGRSRPFLASLLASAPEFILAGLKCFEVLLHSINDDTNHLLRIDIRGNVTDGQSEGAGVGQMRYLGKRWTGHAADMGKEVRSGRDEERE
mmetsp:Transcript_7945/g.22155  ORF Transcript_7945/g.22155 Transcript_7945/m.22155 type:complete len:201 (+) Transcript_7945:1431-2033(+)